MFFVVAVGMTAAAFGDPFVEMLGNLGTFGPHYRDANHLGVVPALVLGAAFALALAVRRTLAGRGAAGRDEAIVFARTAAKATDARSLASVLAFELLAVYAIEAFEAVCSGTSIAQHAGAFSWLGAPLAIALALHMSVAWFTLRCVRTIAASSLAAFERLVTVLERFIVALVRPGSVARPVGVRRAATLHTASEYTWRVHGLRAPPALVPSRR